MFKQVVECQLYPSQEIFHPPPYCLCSVFVIQQLYNQKAIPPRTLLLFTLGSQTCSLKICWSYYHHGVIIYYEKTCASQIFKELIVIEKIFSRFSKMCTNVDTGCVFSLTYILIVRIICGAICYVNKIFFFSKVLICDSITPLTPS